VRHDWGQKDSPVYLFGSSSIERDTICQLELRTTVGAGLGYLSDRYRSPGSLVEGQVLGRYESVELMLSEESAHRLSSNTSWQQRPMVFPNLSTSGAFRATFESVLSVAMSRNLNLIVSLIDRYDSRRPRS
jgi:putative salt-induced outer membrane protein